MTRNGSRSRARFVIVSFGFRSSFAIRHSSLALRHPRGTGFEELGVVRSAGF